MKKLISFFAILFMISLVSASLGTFKLNECIQIKTIFNSSFINISTISYPNSSIAITDSPMSKTGGTFNYTFCNTTEIGTYVYDYYNENGDVYVNSFEITPTGINPTTAQGGLSIGVIVSILAIMIFFGWLAFKFIEKDETFAFGLFFLVMSMILSVYGLFLGYIFSRDFLLTSISAVQEKIFISALLSLTGIMLIAFIFLFMNVIKNLKIRKMKKNYGEDYNTKTRQYDY